MQALTMWESPHNAQRAGELPARDDHSRHQTELISHTFREGRSHRSAVVKADPKRTS